MNSEKDNHSLPAQDSTSSEAQASSSSIEFPPKEEAKVSRPRRRTSRSNASETSSQAEQASEMPQKTGAGLNTGRGRRSSKGAAASDMTEVAARQMASDEEARKLPEDSVQQRGRPRGSGKKKPDLPGKDPAGKQMAEAVKVALNAESETSQVSSGKRKGRSATPGKTDKISEAGETASASGRGLRKEADGKGGETASDAIVKSIASKDVQAASREKETKPVASRHSAHPGQKAASTDIVEALETDVPTKTDVPTETDVRDEVQTDSVRRKSRRGRRGGRGRGRKNRVLEERRNEGESDAMLVAGENLQIENIASESKQDLTASIPETSAVQPSVAESAEDSSEKKGKTKKSREKSSAGNKRMFISVLPGEQVEVALAEDGVLLEYYLDMLHQCKLKGNIYKGVIHNIDANLQAAFVNYGNGKNGFLQIDEVHPEYWLAPHEPAKGKKFPPIQKVLKPGQELLVQVVKEPTGNKGAFLTTWLSLAGRFLVLTPGQEQIGVSRKVNDQEERNRLREMMNGIDPGSGLGVIVRTVSAGTTKGTLRNDLQYLKRLWRDIRKRATEVSAPALVHQEPGLSERAVRDYLTEDVGEIWVDNESEAENVSSMVSLLFPRKKDMVRLYDDVRQSLWDRFNLRRQLEQIYAREVVLPSGGRLVFDQTEALMAIDINSGKISGKGNFEDMAFKTNMEAAEAIARQLRLRDIGGQVVIDFIEMRDKKHVLEVEKTLRQAMKNDRARHDVARMSYFGLLELVRQRMGSSALSITLESCPACCGTGFRRNLEWRALQALRDLRSRLRTDKAQKCVFEAEHELGLYLLNHKRDTLRDMEQQFGKCVEISLQP